jgi:carboxypeptidase Q
MKYRRLALPLLSVMVAASVAILGGQVQDRPDLDAIYKIKDEGFQRSKVMEIMSYLTDVHGPRLTNSPNIKAAANWTMQQMRAWGLTNVKLEPWGPFGRGWSNEKFYLQATAPQKYQIFGYSKAWAPGTSGVVSGEAVMVTIDDEKDLETYRGKLRGKFVMAAPAADVAASFTALGHRYDEGELEALSKQPSPAGGRGGRGGRGGQPGGPNLQDLARKRMELYVSEGVLATLEPSRGVNGGTIFVGGAQSMSTGGRGNPMSGRDPKDPPSVPQVVLAAEHYNRIARTLEKKIPVTLEMNVENKFHDADLNSFNIVGEIAGTDKADELVMVGAHFDSWHGGTGATDNAAGSAVMLEAMRILKASGLRMHRTVRIGLWTGEEQGILGSRAYVTEHFADRTTMVLKPEHAKLSGYFNVDNGTGAIRGVYLQGNEAVAPTFESWMEPFKNLGMHTLTIRNTGGTDHLSFDAVGLPGFQFIQDAVEYDTRTHHSNMDVYERIQAADMMQNAVIVASFVYNTANREQKLPRKPLPKPQPPAGRGTASQP